MNVKMILLITSVNGLVISICRRQDRFQRAVLVFMTDFNHVFACKVCGSSCSIQTLCSVIR